MEIQQPTKRNSIYDTTLQRIMPHLPPLLRKGTQKLKTAEEQLLFIYTMLTVLSSLFTRMSFKFRRRRTYTNLFLFVSGPPGSGKGLMEDARTALAKIHDYLLAESKRAQVAYREQLALATKNKTAPPDKPPFSILFLPASCTAAKMMAHLTWNGNNPITLLATEASELKAAMDSQYGGGISEIGRKCYHNETLAKTTMANDTFIEVPNPKLSMAISGTPEQIIKLIGSAEDGFYSRCQIFAFEGSVEWQDVDDVEEESFSDLLRSQQDEYFKLWRFYAERDVTFTLTSSQFKQLNEMFREELHAVSLSKNPYALGIPKRHACHLYKLAGVLTALRMYHLNNTDTYLECEDNDFAIAKELTSLSLDASLEFLERLPSPKLPARPKDKKLTFAASLNKSFTRAEALDAGLKLKVSSRTVDRWLVSLVEEGRLQLEAHGQYLCLN